MVTFSPSAQYFGRHGLIIFSGNLALFSFFERTDLDGPTSVRSCEKDIIFTRTVRKRLMMLSESETIYFCRKKMPGEERYDDEHRIFLQGLMCKGILNFKVEQVIISCHRLLINSSYHRPVKKDYFMFRFFYQSFFLFSGEHATYGGGAHQVSGILFCIDVFSEILLT